MRVFIDGGAGTTGLGIRDRLKRFPVDVVEIASDKRKESQARLELMHQSDLVILCLPDEAARDAVALVQGMKHVRFIDASSAHRVASAWTYGFPELCEGQKKAISGAKYVTNPGCYPTGAISLLRPLIDAKLLPDDYPVTINAVSGYSGGGRQEIEAHERSGGPAFELYGLSLDHKHVPEIMKYARLKRRPLFVPSVGHFARGMIVSIPLHLSEMKGQIRVIDVESCLRTRYAGCDDVIVAPSDKARLDASHLAGRDVMELRVHGNENHRHVVLTASLDNLGKGASGAAIRNLCLMYDVKESKLAR